MIDAMCQEEVLWAIFIWFGSWPVMFATSTVLPIRSITSTPPWWDIPDISTKQKEEVYWANWFSLIFLLVRDSVRMLIFVVIHQLLHFPFWFSYSAARCSWLISASSIVFFILCSSSLNSSSKEFSSLLTPSISCLILWFFIGIFFKNFLWEVLRF